MPRTLFFTRKSYDFMRKNIKKGSPGCPRFEPQNGPQNGSGGYSKVGPNLEQFLVQFRGRFWANFGGPRGSKTGPEGVRRDPRERAGAPRGQKNDLRKSGFRIGLSAHFRSWDAPRRSQEAQKRAKVRPVGALKPKKRPSIDS